MKKAAVAVINGLLVFFFGSADVFAVPSYIIDAGDSVTVSKNEFVFTDEGLSQSSHYGFLFNTKSSAPMSSSLTFSEDEFVLKENVSCEFIHNIYGFWAGTTETTKESTSVSLTGNTVKLLFEDTKGFEIYGFNFMNNSHDNSNPLKNVVNVNNLIIDFSNNIQASNFAAGIKLAAQKLPGDIKSTSNYFVGDTLFIDVANNVEQGLSKPYSVGIMSQGDLLKSLFHYNKTIDIQTSTTVGAVTSFGIYLSTNKGITDINDKHIFELYAPEINVVSKAVENNWSYQGKGIGAFIAGANPTSKKQQGKTIADIGVIRDWNKIESDFFNSIIETAENVSVYGSGNALYATNPNTWLTVGAGNIYLTSESNATVVAESGARVVLTGNSFIESLSSEKKYANALVATNDKTYNWDGGLTNIPFEDPGSKIHVMNGNHVIKGDIVALDGGIVNIYEGKHQIEGDIYTLGQMTNTSMGDTRVTDAKVSVVNKGGFFTGKADTFYRNKENIIARENEKDFYMDEPYEHGKISLAFSDGAVWNMTDRSFVTDLSLKGSSAVSVNYGRKPGDSGRGLFVENLDISEHSGGIFNMTLNGTDKTKSDMLYVLDGTADTNGKFSKNYVINLQNSDLFALMRGETIRYATVNGDDVKDTLTQRVVSIGSGILNLEFETGAEKFDKNDSENKDYNGAEGSLTKPGNSLIVSEFDKDGSYNLFIQGIKRPDPTPDPTPDPDPDPDPGNPDPDPGNPGPDPTPEPDPTPLPPIHTGLSRSVSAVFDMSYFSYIQIIQPDRLNKRVGDVFNLGSDDDGLWFRTTYDDLGITDITSQSYSLQGGYDKLYKNDDFSLRFGVSGRYTDTDIDFASSNANGKLSATQISVYGTYIGANDWFFDVTARYGFLSSKTNLITESGFGYESQYDNEFQGLSLEAGKRFSLYADNVHQFYFAPQVSLSYLHIDDVNYITNQGSRIGISAIDSLISRVGAKLGYVYDNKMQAALKWDWFREWNGAQHFSMVDNTTFGIPVERGIEAETSWYDIGLTLQMNIKENIAVYADVEKLYGGLYEDSYRYSAGMRITF